MSKAKTLWQAVAPQVPIAAAKVLIALAAMKVFIAMASGADLGTGSPPMPTPAAKPAAAKPVVKQSLTTPAGWHEYDPNEVLRPGNHWHRDPITGLVKQHGPEFNGNADAHRAPGGNIVWEKATQPVRYMRICENGRCRLVPIQ